MSEPKQSPSFFNHMMERHMQKSPDYEDTVEKIKWTSIKAACALALMGVIDCTSITRVKNFKQGLNCVGFWVIPGTALAASWACGVFLSARLRQKEDYYNYMIGGLATTPMVRYIGNSAFNVWQVMPLILLGSALIKAKKDNKSFYIDRDETRDYGIYSIDLRLSKEEDKYYRSQYPFKC